MTANTATITHADFDAFDGFLRLTARCATCGRPVHHGGGNDIERPALGDRVGHCGCDGYDLIDPDGVIAEAMPRLRIAYEAHQRLHEQSVARRAARRAAVTTTDPDAATASAV